MEQGAGGDAPDRTPDDWTPWADTPATGTEAATEDADDESSVAPTARAARPRETRSRVSRSETETPISVGGITVVIGAVFAIAGTFLTMVRVGVPTSSLSRTVLSQTYFESDDGKVVAAIAAVVLIVALLFLMRVGDTLVAQAAVAVGGLAILGLSIYDRVDLDNSVDDLQSSLRIPRAALDVSIGPAVYTCMFGGVLVVVGAVLSARRR
jgi:hypothetical protein